MIRALARPRGEDWSMMLSVGDDYMDADLDEGGTPRVDCEVGDKLYTAVSAIGDETLKAMFLGFLAGDGSWRDQCLWVEPDVVARERAKATSLPPAAVSGIAMLVVAVILAMVFLRKAAWVGFLFALVYPGFIAFAALVKMRAAKRAASWTQGNARILKSELITQTRRGKEVKVPAVEYEFTISFKPIRGRRVSLAEIVSGPQAEAAVQKYRPGTSAPVFYNPADPSESVLERDLPPHFHWIWAFVAVLFAACIAGAWFLI